MTPFFESLGLPYEWAWTIATVLAIVVISLLVMLAVAMVIYVDRKVLGAYSRDVLNENGKLLLCFAEDSKLALLNTFYSTSKRGVSYTFPSANRGKGQSRLDYILTKQADR